MSLPANFFDAHERHHDDATSLYDRQRWANADHLFGVAAECGLKALIVGMKGGALSNNEKRHINEATKPENAWDIFETYLNGHILGTKYTLPSANPFLDWDISDRYAHQSNFDSTVVEPHREGANVVQDLVITAQVEGIL
jgi:hypothetical protein